MKKVFFTALMLIVAMGYSQKSNNGKVFNEHPAIDIVNEMMNAFFAGDADKVASYLADDFKSYNGTGLNKDAKGNSKEQFIDQTNFIKENLSYVSYTTTKGAYPDAIEYKDSGIWVQTWNHLKAMHNITGVKIDMPTHRLFKLNDDNKIVTIINYNNERVFNEISQSFEDRENGTIYNHHDNINTVRKMMNAFENKDLETAYSFFKEDARFNSLELPDGETLSLDEVKERNKQMMEKYDITSIDVVGYPDYLEYDIADSRAVQSWWKLRMTRKSDGKEIVLPALYIHDFDENGKIIRSNAYISTKILDAK
jgi:ketosteroid isomerase-like protein